MVVLDITKGSTYPIYSVSFIFKLVLFNSLLLFSLSKTIMIYIEII